MLFRYFIRFQLLMVLLSTVVMFQNCGGQFQFRNIASTNDKLLIAGGTEIEDPPAPTDSQGGISKALNSLGLCWIPHGNSNGVSERIALSENLQTLSISHGVAKDACVTQRACEELLPPYFDVSHTVWRASAVCTHNRNLDLLSDAQVVALIKR